MRRLAILEKIFGKRSGMSQGPGPGSALHPDSEELGPTTGKPVSDEDMTGE